MRNPTREVAGLEMNDFIKRGINEMIGFWGSAQNEKSGPGAPELEMTDFIKKIIKEMIGFWWGAQNEKSGSEGTRARNERFYREKY